MRPCRTSAIFPRGTRDASTRDETAARLARIILQRLRDPIPVSEAVLDDRLVAIDDPVVTVNMPICFACFNHGPLRDPLDTAAGLETILAALERRPGP